MKNIITVLMMVLALSTYAQNDTITVQKRTEDAKGGTHYYVDFFIKNEMVPKMDSIVFDLVKNEVSINVNTVVFVPTSGEIFYIDGWKRPLLPSGDFSMGGTAFMIQSSQKNAEVRMTIYFKDQSVITKKYF